MTANPQIIVPTDSPSVFSALNTLVMANGTTLAIIRPNNPPPGIAGFVFDIVEQDGFRIRSSITDYVTSANSSVQDHVALMPEEISVGGTVAELVLSQPISQPIATITNPLPNLPGMGPQLTTAAQSNVDAQDSAAGVAETTNNSTQSLWAYYNQKSPQQPNQTRQSLIAGYIYQLWLGRMLFTVETPWGFFTNMAIVDGDVSQGAESKWSSQFEIVFKKIRYAQTQDIQPGLLAGRAFGQQSTVAQNGEVGQLQTTAQQDAQFTQKVTNPSP